MSDLLRTLDANLNRAREALRVMEDVARFELSDWGLAAALKQARHDLRAVVEAAGVDPLTLAAWRDTPGDVGTGMSAKGERDRAGIMGVLGAAGKRAGEALRVVEETVKTLPSSGEADRAVKALRYRVYELEKRMTLALGTGSARQWRLCVLLTESLCTHHPWERVAEMAISGGADCVQLREKNLEGGELLERARGLVSIARLHGRPEYADGGVAVIINDRPDVALIAGADGVHVGQGDVGVADVRKLAGGRLMVGVSTTNMEQALSAAREGADYCGVGPMFATTTKNKPGLAGPEYLKAYLAEPRTARVPSLAIGGIDPERAAELRECGCRGVAVSGAVCSAEDPAMVCEKIVAALG